MCERKKTYEKEERFFRFELSYGQGVTCQRDDLPFLQKIFDSNSELAQPY